MPDHIKRKILLFFLEHSVPRIIEENRKEAANAEKRNRIIQ